MNTLELKEKARDVLFKELNEAIKKFEETTGLKVTRIEGDRIAIHYSNGYECDSKVVFTLTSKV